MFQILTVVQQKRLSEEHLSGIGKQGIDSCILEMLRSGHGDPSSFCSKVKTTRLPRSGIGQTQLSLAP